MQKQCKGCGIVKPLTDYHKVKTVADGRNSRCKECRNAEARAWRRENPEKQQAANDRWREANAERYAEIQRAWDRANKHRHAEYRKNNPERVAENLARWKADNRERVREYQRRRRAAGYGGRAELLDAEALWSKHGGVCPLCATAIDRTLQWPDPMSPSVDHIQPLSKGGLHTAENTQWVHLVCNLRKGDRPCEPYALAAVVPISQEDTNERPAEHPGPRPAWR